VGTSTGKGLVGAGHDVTFVDILPSRIDELRAQGLDATNDMKLAGEPESFVFLTLPTPCRDRVYDLSAFKAGVRTVGRALVDSDVSHTVIVRSTVPPGTTVGLVRQILEAVSGKRCGAGFTLASNPEFLRAASAADDFRSPWMTVIAARDAGTVAGLVALLAPFGGELRTFADPTVAEVIKCAHNLFNAAKISFWNEMWLVCQELGIDHQLVSSTVARSAEGSFNPRYGIRGGAAYGGACLPKDTQGFLGFAESINVDMPLLRAVIAVNDRLDLKAADGMPPLIPRQPAPLRTPAESGKS
jgi:UDPglucose 6-dehydrogenase